MFKIIKIIKEMMELRFTEDSKLVKMWFVAVLAGVYHPEDVPALFNLREIVNALLDEMGYPNGSSS